MSGKSNRNTQTQNAVLSVNYKQGYYEDIKDEYVYNERSEWDVFTEESGQEKR